MQEIIEKLNKNDSKAYETLVKCLMEKINLEEQPADAHWLADLIFELENNARKGITPAMVLLGNAYLNGWSVVEDVQKALKYARHAASLNDGGGEVLLGFMYANGYGVVQDYKRAMQWFNSAIKKGDSMALNNMGAIYEDGLGVKKDIALALKYYKQAAAQNNDFAIANLERLQGGKVS